MSAPFRITRKTLRVVAREPGADVKEYLERLIKLIPAEVISLYLVGKGIIETDRYPLLEALDQDWLDPERLITGLIGFGGEGKSSLARRWVEHVLHSELPQLQGVFWWGFYERRNMDEFFEGLLRYLIPQIDANQLPSSSAKIQVINAVFKSKRYLFILDGLEVMQHQEGDEYGLLTSVDLKNWLRDFAEGGHQSFCLITSCAPMLDLIDCTTYTHREVERLSDAEGVQLLRNLGVQGDPLDILRVVQQ
jgi:hypothetical protein